MGGDLGALPARLGGLPLKAVDLAPNLFDLGSLAEELSEHEGELLQVEAGGAAVHLVLAYQLLDQLLVEVDVHFPHHLKHLVRIDDAAAVRVSSIPLFLQIHRKCIAADEIVHANISCIF